MKIANSRIVVLNKEKKLQLQLKMIKLSRILKMILILKNKYEWSFKEEINL